MAPPKKVTPHQDRTIKVHCTEADEALIDAAVERAMVTGEAVSRSDWARGVLLAAAQAPKPPRKRAKS